MSLIGDSIDDLLKLTIPMELFVGEENKAVHFSISPSTDIDTSDYLKKVRKLIEKGGGLLDNQPTVIGKYKIPLIRKGNVSFDCNDMFKIQFVFDCVKEKHLLDLNLYRANETQYEGDVDANLILNCNKSWDNFKRKVESECYVPGFSDDDTPEATKNTPRPRWKLYTLEEDRILVNYIVEGERYLQTRGKTLWEKMASEKICVGRSWQSMKERYIKIVPNLSKFKLDPQTIVKLQEVFHSNMKVHTESIQSNEVECSVSLSNKDLSAQCDLSVQSPCISSQGDITPEEFETQAPLLTQQTTYYSCTSKRDTEHTQTDCSHTEPTSDAAIHVDSLADSMPTSSDFSMLPQSTQFDDSNDKKILDSAEPVVDDSSQDDNEEDSVPMTDSDKLERTASFNDNEFLASANPLAGESSKDDKEGSITITDTSDKREMSASFQEYDQTLFQLDCIVKPEITADVNDDLFDLIEEEKEEYKGPSKTTEETESNVATEETQIGSEIDFLDIDESEHSLEQKNTKQMKRKKKSRETDSSDDDGPQKYHKGVLFTFKEDMKILQFIEKYNSYCLVKGVFLWQRMEAKKIIKGRSWQSLKERYLKRIIRQFDCYKGNGLSKVAEEKFADPKNTNNEPNDDFIDRMEKQEHDRTTDESESYIVTDGTHSGSETDVLEFDKSENCLVQKNRKQVKRKIRVIESSSDDSTKDIPTCSMKRSPFSFKEDMKILQFIEKYESYCLVKGVMIWQKMESKKIVKGRTWQSLKERYRKRILKQFHFYKGKGLSEKAEEMFIKQTPANCKPKKRIFAFKSHYRMEEDIKILNFIAKNKRYSQIGGVVLWKLMESRFEDKRSWQSMKNRFLKHILKNLDNYSIKLEERKQFQKLIRNITDTSNSESEESSEDNDLFQRRNKLSDSPSKGANINSENFEDENITCQQSCEIDQQPSVPSDTIVDSQETDGISSKAINKGDVAKTSDSSNDLHTINATYTKDSPADATFDVPVKQSKGELVCNLRARKVRK